MDPRLMSTTVVTWIPKDDPTRREEHPFPHRRAACFFAYELCKNGHKEVMITERDASGNIARQKNFNDIWRF